MFKTCNNTEFEVSKTKKYLFRILHYSSASQQGHENSNPMRGGEGGGLQPYAPSPEFQPKY